MGYVATIGFFDGVHTGHRFVLQELCRTAVQRNMHSMVVTFRNHPRKVLEHDFSAQLLTSPEERVRLLTHYGVEKVEMLSFDEVRDYTAAEFMRWLHDKKEVELLLMGYDHRFGSDGLRIFSDYEAASRGTGVQLLQLPEYAEDKVRVSSTMCRRLLQQGAIEEANRLLGYPYMLSGMVGHGREIGRTIGFPTANLLPGFSDKLLPGEGVYIASALADGRSYRALVNIGTNPTVQASVCSIEVYLYDFSGDLYGKQMEIRLLHYLREEHRFASLEELRQQIEADKRALLAFSEDTCTQTD